LNELGISLHNRFNRFGKLPDIDKTITIRQQVIDLAPGHPDMGTHLSRLGQSLYSRFKHTGFLADLEKAISSHQRAVDI
ncbi:hypothetical protein M422DRAFT_144349, partial [Sphaerobolus stellatus SS14]